MFNLTDKDAITLLYSSQSTERSAGESWYCNNINPAKSKLEKESKECFLFIYYLYI